MVTRIGLVGCGGWGQHILRDLRSLGCVVDVVERSEPGRSRAAGLGAERTVATVAELESVDGVVVATPVGTHAHIIHEALDLGVKVYTEKSMTDDAADAADLAKRAPDDLFVMEKWRYHPAIIRLAELARSGALGPVAGLASVRRQWGDSHRDTDPVWTLLPHDLSIALHVLGVIPPPVAARRVGGEFADSLGRDGALPTADFVGLYGILGTDPWVQVDVSGRALETRREVVLYGEEGTATVFGADYTKVHIQRPGDPEPTIEIVPPTMPLLAELDAFVRHVQGEGPAPHSSAAEGALNVRRIVELRELADR